MNRVLSVLAITVALGTFAGCGDPIGTVSGTITLDGQPGSGLVVSFTPEGGGTSGAGTTDAEGNYTVASVVGAGLPPGKYSVSITTSKTTEDDGEAEEMSSDSDAYANQAAGNDYKDANKFKEKIPAEYNSESTLAVDIVAGSNEAVNFDIKSK